MKTPNIVFIIIKRFSQNETFTNFRSLAVMILTIRMLMNMINKLLLLLLLLLLNLSSPLWEITTTSFTTMLPPALPLLLRVDNLRVKMVDKRPRCQENRVNQLKLDLNGRTYNSSWCWTLYTSSRWRQTLKTVDTDMWRRTLIEKRQLIAMLIVNFLHVCYWGVYLLHLFDDICLYVFFYVCLSV